MSFLDSHNSHDCHSVISNQANYVKLRNKLPNDFLADIYENRRISIDEFEEMRQLLSNEFFHNLHLRAYLSAYISDFIITPNIAVKDTNCLTITTVWRWICTALYNTYFFTFHTHPPPREEEPLCQLDAAYGDYYNCVRIDFMSRVVVLFEDNATLQAPIPVILRTLRKYVATLLQFSSVHPKNQLSENDGEKNRLKDSRV